MVDLNLGKKTISLVLAMSFMLSGCLPTDVASTRQAASTINPAGSSTSGAGAGATDDSTDTSSSTITPKIEIRHLIEPNFSTDTTYSSGTGTSGGGTYVRKLTLPKNFAGKLYLAGINIATLASRFVKVRFKFGLSRDPITISATVAKAPGITPSTDIHVLVMDMRPEHFRDVRLTYDLFDYNEYGASDTPIQDNRDTGLYCRALNISDDPTFEGVGNCDAEGEECLYAYAKVLDQGLVKATTSGSSTVYVPITPTLPQVKSVVGADYYADSVTAALQKPLLDNVSGPFLFTTSANASTSTSSTINFAGSPIDWAAKLINGSTYYYRGPYRNVNKTEWQFKLSNLIGPNRIYRSSVVYGGSGSIAAPDDGNVYFGSYLYPLATQMNLNPNVTHLASNNWNDVRTETSLSAAGKTLWMDGSNIRANSKNSNLEHIGSCNVTSSIEIIATDDNGNEYVVASSTDVKLQLVRPVTISADTSNDVLYSNFKTCTTNSACGGSECCFNNRCWDQSLVSQCIDSSSGTGNAQIGASCSTDLDCTSLCCNATTGLCSPHDTNASTPVLCSKPIGSFCIAKEWCQKSPVIKCLIVKTGTTASGDITCRQQCYTTEEYGDCKNGTCTAPYQETIPTFDPNAEGACDNAVAAPSF